jgi:drug/metabolite transporter (DMT)-like permease
MMAGPMRDLIWESRETRPEDRRLKPAAIYVLLVVVVLVLGLNWPIMATAVKSITPIWMGVFRLGGATLVVVTLAVATRKLRVPPKRDLPIVGSLAVFRLGAVTLLVFTALQMIPPGRSSVVTWTTPLWTVPLAAIFLGDRINIWRWLGLALGITGVVILFEPWGLDWANPDIAIGHGLLILAAITNASTSVHIRRHKWSITPLEALPWQLAGATLILLALAVVTDGAPIIEWTPALVAIVAYQGILASGIALWAQIVILRNIDPVSANLTMMGVPAVGVTSSAFLLGERITPELAAGLVLITLGVTLNLLSGREQDLVSGPV